MNNNEQEANFFGMTKSLRQGFFTAILGLSLAVNVFFYIDNKRTDKEKLEMQEKMYERVIQSLAPTVNKMNNAVEKVDTAVINVSNSALKVDSVTNMIINKNKE